LGRHCSSTVYGDTETLPTVETAPENPLSPYVLTKQAGEKYCGLFYRIYSLPSVALRNMHRRDGVTFGILRRILKGLSNAWGMNRRLTSWQGRKVR
jgi:nucleoside-diphosphate-sugar epimerase